MLRRAKTIFRLELICLSLLFGFISAAFGQSQNTFYEIETKYIFGFTEGSGIGLEGEKEISPDSVIAIGKHTGSYVTSQTKLKYEFTPNQFMQFELGPIVSSHHIRNVTDLDDVNRFSFGGGFLEFRYLLLDRPASPLAVTIAIEPEWHRTDETSGQYIQNLGLETRINADLEIVPKRLFFGFNLLYEPETTRDATGVWTNEATVGGSAALSYRIFQSVVVGAEVWYLRHYETIGLSQFTGDSVYAGPNIYVQLNNKMFVTAAWNAQISGREVGELGKFDLTDFSRQRIKLKFAFEF